VYREPIWNRPEPPRRRPPAPLSRQAIVGAALGLADAEGLEAVSVRRMASELGAGPMRLYGYVGSKDELLALLVDRVYGEIEAPTQNGDWRARLRAIAQGTERVARRHPWFVSIAGAHPPQGPNGLRLLEGALAAVDGLGLDAGEMVRAVHTVFAYAIGFVQLELVPSSAPQEPADDYVARMVAGGELPTLARVFGSLGPVDAERSFASSLELVLDGLAARIEPSGGQGRTS
jgi:AcrR family transcriptional regulator